VCAGIAVPCQACMLLPVSVWSCRIVHEVEGRSGLGQGIHARVLTGIETSRESGQGSYAYIDWCGCFALSLVSPEQCLLKYLEASREHPSRCRCGMHEAFKTGVLGAAGRETDVPGGSVTCQLACCGPQWFCSALAEQRMCDTKEDSLLMDQGPMWGVCWHVGRKEHCHEGWFGQCVRFTWSAGCPSIGC
jgi:hypothetical protein